MANINDTIAALLNDPRVTLIANTLNRTQGWKSTTTKAMFIVADLNHHYPGLAEFHPDTTTNPTPQPDPTLDDALDDARTHQATLAAHQDTHRRL